MMSDAEGAGGSTMKRKDVRGATVKTTTDARYHVFFIVSPQARSQEQVWVDERTKRIEDMLLLA
jgi:hypothetical protein